MEGACWEKGYGDGGETDELDTGRLGRRLKGQEADKCGRTKRVRQPVRERVRQPVREKVRQPVRGTVRQPVSVHKRPYIKMIMSTMIIT